MGIPELKSVMLVEDEPDIRAVAALALERLGGWNVVLCSSGEEALAKARGLAPDIIILDVLMPGIDGPGTLAKLREMPELSRTPVVFMTARVLPAEVAHYKELGAAEVIKKPFDPLDLPATLRKVWSRHHGQ